MELKRWKNFINYIYLPLHVCGPRVYDSQISSLSRVEHVVDVQKRTIAEIFVLIEEKLEENGLDLVLVT